MVVATDFPVRREMRNRVGTGVAAGPRGGDWAVTRDGLTREDTYACMWKVVGISPVKLY